MHFSAFGNLRGRKMKNQVKGQYKDCRKNKWMHKYHYILLWHTVWSNCGAKTACLKLNSEWHIGDYFFNLFIFLHLILQFQAFPMVIKKRCILTYFYTFSHIYSISPRAQIRLPVLHFCIQVNQIQSYISPEGGYNAAEGVQLMAKEEISNLVTSITV